MKRLFILFVFVHSYISCCAQQTKNILFVGNSLTYYHDMPQTLQKMLDEQGSNIQVEQSTFPGMPLSSHLMRVQSTDGSWRRAVDAEITPTVRKILSKNWDVVVLQEGTSFLLVPESYQYNFQTAMIQLDSIIKTVKAKTILYQPFAGNSYPVQVCYPGSSILANMLLKNNKINSDRNYCSDTFQNSAQQFDTLQSKCSQISKIINCDVARVGYTFEACKKQYPDIDLYEPDNEHPSIAGSYLIACVFYKFFTHKKVADIRYRGNEKSGLISEVNANQLRQLVDSVFSAN